MRRLLLVGLLALSTGCQCSGLLTIGGLRDAGAQDAGARGPDGGAASLDAGAGDCPATCSDDLKSTVDCHGASTPCPAGQGCSPQGCIDACQAAAASGSTIGCDFYVAAVPPEFETLGSCYSAFIANTWSTPVRLTVDRGATHFDPSLFARIPRQGPGGLSYDALPVIDGAPALPAGAMAVLFLGEYDTSTSYFVGCPVPAAMRTDFQLDGTGLLDAFHLTASAPVVAYDMYPYGGAASHVSSASLLIPTSAWGTNYVAVDPAPAYLSQGTAIGSPYLQLYAQSDDTTVAIQAPVAIAGGPGVTGAAANAVVHYTLARGQVLQLEQPEELSGAFITSNKPISVWGGHSCMDVPLGVIACDSGHQQLPAVPLLGNDYQAVRYGARVAGDDEQALWRFVGAVDGTRLTFDPPQAGAPVSLSAGQTVDLSAPGPFRVSSQDADHIFSLSELMTGGANTQGIGDPDYVSIVPPLQYLKSYLFFTDASYAHTDLVFVRGPGSDGQLHDVTLDCAGLISGWAPIGASGFEYARHDWEASGGGCANGVHTAHSDAPFGLTVWGTDSFTSYGYPAGMSVRPINTVVVGPIIN